MSIFHFLHNHGEITFPIARVLLIKCARFGKFIGPRIWYSPRATKISLWLLKRHSTVFNFTRLLCERILNPDYKPIFKVTHLPREI